MKRKFTPVVIVCLPLIHVRSSVGLIVGNRWPMGRAYGFCSGSSAVWNKAGPVTPENAWPKRVYPKLNTLIRFGLRIAVYCAETPLLLSRRVEAGAWPGNCARI